MTSSRQSTRVLAPPQPAASPLASTPTDTAQDEFSAIVDGLFQDAKAIDDRNRQMLQRVRALQVMIEARNRAVN